jgi:phosphate:Na+ symporter
MWQAFSLRELLGWLSIFLFGIHIFSDSIKDVGSITLKRMLRRTTNTPLKGIASGSLASGILQSSTMITIMVLGFVGANIIDLGGAIGAMIWASIGTTTTSWIVAFLWFKVDVSIIALPLIVLGWFSLFIFGKKKKFKAASLFLFWFGLLLFGLGMMKESIEMVKQVFDLSMYLDLPKIWFLLLGIVLTIIIQSSTATNTIVIASLSTGLIPLPIAMMMMLGAHIGTSFTSIIVWLTGTRTQKQVASVHVTFNSFAALIWLVLMQPFIWFLWDIVWLSSTDVLNLAIFHTGFNVIGACIFYWFIPWFHRLLDKVFKQKKELYLSVMDVDMADIDTWLVACRQDIVSLAKDVLQYNVSLFHIDYHKLIDKNLDYTFEQYSLDIDILDKLYDHIKSVESHLIQYCMHLHYGDDDKQLSARVAEFNYAIMQLVQSAKMLKDISHNIEEVVRSEKSVIQQEAARFAGKVRNIYVDVMDILTLEEHSQQYMKLLDLFRSLKTDDRKYIITIQDMVSNDEISAEELSDLLRVQRYIYNSSKSYLLAVRELIISKKERLLMENQVDKDVDSILPSLLDDNTEENIFQWS